MSIAVMNLVWLRAPYQGNTLLTLLALADWSDDSGRSWPAVETLAKKSRQSDRNTQLCLKRLAGDKFVTIEERPGTSSLYVIDLKKLRGCNDFTPKSDAEEGCNPCAQISPNTSDTSLQEPPLKPRSAHFVLPNWIPQTNWEEFEVMRKKIKKPMTDFARQLLVRKLDELRRKGHSPSMLLDEAILHGWQSVYEPKTNGNGSRRDCADRDRPPLLSETTI